MSHRFRTLERAVEVRGVGLHCGQPITARLLPASQVGVLFVRSDLPGTPSVRAEVGSVSTTTHATTIESGAARVSTIEHLLAALWASDLTHVRVELDGPEVPILDGSALPWLELLSGAGWVELDDPRPIARLKAPVWLESKGAQMLGLPLGEEFETPTFRLSVGVDFDVPGAGTQTFDGSVNAACFARELAPARTFTLQPWLASLRAAGLIRGGSLDNAVLVGDDGTPSSPLRFSDEFARHKALDCVGDLALALCETGARFHGHIVAIRAGHGAHRDWVLHALSCGALEIDVRNSND